jgi:nucleoside-diphosphate-sugar epimerase
MNILLIGGLGNIGTPVTHQLARMGHTVIVVGRRELDDLPENIRYLTGDTQDVRFLARIQKEYLIEIVINFAIQTPEQANANIQAFTDQIKQFIYISTVTVLDRETQVVLSETSDCGNPFSAYAQRKLACEQLFLNAYQTSGFPVTIVRPAQTYSNEKFPLSVKGKSYWSVIDRILNDKPVIVHGDGTSTWVSMHRDDFCPRFIPLVGHSEAIGAIYHVTGDEILTWNMIYHELGRQLNKQVHLVHVPTDQLEKSQQYDLRTAIKGDKQYSVIFDNRKTNQLSPDHQTRISLQTGLSLFLTYMAQHPELKITDPAFDRWCDDVIEHGVIA